MRIFLAFILADLILDSSQMAYANGGNPKSTSFLIEESSQTRQPDRKQPMYDIQVNHVYFVVDKETYEAIKGSDFVRSLAFTYEQKNSADNQIGWEGFYIRGKHTYIELFYPQERYPSIGISGIGMGVDYAGGLDAISEGLQNDLPNLKRGSLKRQGKPWFEYLAVNDSYFYEKNSFWIMEYAPEYFSENSEDISRVHYNKKYDLNKPFLDITKFAIALRPEGLDTLSTYLKSFGLREQGDSYLTSENIEIQLVEEDESRKGIYQIDFSLSEQFGESYSCRLGNSILTIHGNKGSWIFFKK